MRYDVSPEEIKQANLPHEIFLTNLIGNHILMAVAVGGIAGSFPWVMALIPATSFLLLGFTLWRARRSRTRDTWYVMCHWQVCARRSRLFILMLTAALGVALAGWAAHVYGGMMKEAVIAMVVGASVLPIMVTVLVLIIIESDALYHANQAKLPDWVVGRFPNADAKVIAEPAAQEPTA